MNRMRFSYYVYFFIDTHIYPVPNFAPIFS
ncbi:protein of unknown function [Azospirillum baldaniorum]|uniref:Uncharacterized protein n=1 Tax=Azospirillum baldaniorum TaxID=1064539 RepID=A0A9P1JNU9_9PROT|nr:protein of unknown function [Azospirillum baldaniorum]